MVEIRVFQGVEYRRYPKSKNKAHRNYFQKKRRIGGKLKEFYLHVAIWEAKYGPVPRGYVVHHKDFNPLNNRLSNLVLMERQAHTDLHRNSGPMREARCPLCHELFQTRNPWKVFCSEEHRKLVSGRRADAKRRGRR
jgi:hypothetical protein